MNIRLLLFFFCVQENRVSVQPDKELSLGLDAFRNGLLCYCEHCKFLVVSWLLLSLFCFFVSADMPVQNPLCWVTRRAAARPCFSHVPTLFPLCASLVWHWPSRSAGYKEPIEAARPSADGSARGRGRSPITSRSL